MSISSCERWTDVWDRAALGEAVSQQDIALAREHAAQCATCAAEVRLYDVLGGCLEAGSEWLSKRPSQALPSRAPHRVARRSRWPYAAVAACLASAAAVAIWWSSEANQSAPGAAAFDAKVVLALASGEVAVEGTTAVAGRALRPANELRIGRGRACLSYAWGATACADEGSVVRLLAPESERRGMRLESGSVVCRLDAQPPGARFSVETSRGRVTATGTVFTIEHLPNAEVAVRLHRGVVEVTPTRGATRELRAPAAVVLGDEMRPVRADDEAWKSDAELIEVAALWSTGALVPLDLTTNPAGALIRLDGFGLGQSPVSALVARGDHEMIAERIGFVPHRERIAVHGEDRVRRSPELEPAPAAIEPASRAASAVTAGPSESAPSAADLLARARALRSAGRYVEAAASYQSLIDVRPASAEARAALVSLGELQLSQLKSPGAALRSFDGYLTREGSLTQEAHYGRIRCLRALGRQVEARRAISEFVQRYPGSAQSKQLQQLSQR